MSEAFLYLYAAFAACLIVLRETHRARKRAAERDFHLDALSREDEQDADEK